MVHSFDPDHFQKAWAFAARWHQGQFYLQPLETIKPFDYLYHLSGVTQETLWALDQVDHADRDLAVQCAVLHDIIEDTGCGYNEIKQEFGDRVANGVLALSKNPGLPDKSRQMDDSLARIVQQPHEIWMVKMADRICNLLAPPHTWTKEEKAFYHQEAIKIYQILQSANPIQAERLWQKIENYRLFIKENL